MISVDDLVFYKYGNQYRFAIISKNENKLVLVTSNTVIKNFNAKDVFAFYYWGGNDIDDEYPVRSINFVDFLHLALASESGQSLITPKPETLPNYKKFIKLKEIIHCRGIKLERDDLEKIEKFLNAKVFKNIIKKENAKIKKTDLEYENF